MSPDTIIKLISTKFTPVSATLDYFIVINNKR